MSTYFDDTGETTGHPGWFFRPHEDLPALTMVDGLDFRVLVSGDGMVSSVRFEPNAPAPAHHHAEHSAVAGPEGCLAVDFFTPPRQAMLQFLKPEQFLT